MTTTSRGTDRGRSHEHELDVRAVRMRDPSASMPGAFKSSYAREGAGWSADIKLDYDRDRSTPTPHGFADAARELAKLGTKIVDLCAYRTRKGFHVRCWLSVPIAALEITRIQRLMGDDPVRCAFNEARVLRGQSGWNVLWSEKWENGKCVSAERRDPQLQRMLWCWVALAREAVTVTKQRRVRR